MENNNYLQEIINEINCLGHYTQESLLDELLPEPQDEWAEMLGEAIDDAARYWDRFIKTGVEIGDRSSMCCVVNNTEYKDIE